MAAGFHRGVSSSSFCPRKRPCGLALSASQGAMSKRERLDNLTADPELPDRFEFKRIGAGLANLGNTCFLNSVLQCLTYTEPLAAYFISGRHKKICSASGFCALCAIQNHVMNALASSGKILAPSHLVKNLRCISRNFRVSRQEDAHEYMVHLMDSMHKCSLPSGIASESASAYEKSLVHKIFGGRLRSRINCPKCSYSSNSYEPFLDLSLQIMHSDSVWKALSEFTAVEQLEVYTCDQCKGKVKALKQFTVDKAPHILAVHLKRFNGLTGSKIDKKVDFGRTLDLNPFMSSKQGADAIYTLYGVLVHAGHSTQSGHYFCFIRTSTGNWHALDDNRVYQVNEKCVFGQKAYMLFYVRNKRSTSIQCLKSERQSLHQRNGGIQDHKAMPKNMPSGKEVNLPGTSAITMSTESPTNVSKRSKDQAHEKLTTTERRLSLHGVKKEHANNGLSNLDGDTSNMHTSDTLLKSASVDMSSSVENESCQTLNLNALSDGSDNLTQCTSLSCHSNEQPVTVTRNHRLPSAQPLESNASRIENSHIRSCHSVSNVQASQHSQRKIEKSGDTSLHSVWNELQLESDASRIENSSITSSSSACGNLQDGDSKSCSSVVVHTEIMHNGSVSKISYKNPSGSADLDTSEMCSITCSSRRNKHADTNQHLIALNDAHGAQINDTSSITDMLVNGAVKMCGAGTSHIKQVNSVDVQILVSSSANNAYCGSHDIANEINNSNFEIKEIESSEDKHGKISIPESEGFHEGNFDCANIQKPALCKRKADNTAIHLRSEENNVLTCQDTYGKVEASSMRQCKQDLMRRKLLKMKTRALQIHYLKLSVVMPFKQRCLLHGVYKAISKRTYFKIKKHFSLKRKTHKGRLFQDHFMNKKYSMVQSIPNFESHVTTLISAIEQPLVSTIPETKWFNEMVGKYNPKYSNKFKLLRSQKHFASQNDLSVKCEQNQLQHLSFLESDHFSPRKGRSIFVSEICEENRSVCFTSDTAVTSGRLSPNPDTNDTASETCAKVERSGVVRQIMRSPPVSTSLPEATKEEATGTGIENGLENDSVECASDKLNKCRVTVAGAGRTLETKNIRGGVKRLYNEYDSSQCSSRRGVQNKRLRRKGVINIPAKIF